MSYQALLGYVPISSSAPRPLGAAYIPILLSEVEREQRPSGNGDCEAIVVGAGLCGNRTFRQRRFGKKIRDVSANFSCRNVPYYLVLFLIFVFWFSTNWLGPVCRIPVCRILELKKNDKTINVGIIQSINCASDISPFPLVPRVPLGPLIFPSC